MSEVRIFCYSMAIWFFGLVIWLGSFEHIPSAHIPSALAHVYTHTKNKKNVANHRPLCGHLTQTPGGRYVVAVKWSCFPHIFRFVLSLVGMESELILLLPMMVR